MWLELGTISPTTAWQRLPQQVIGGEVFRIRQSYLLGGVTAKLIISSLFPNVGRALVRVAYPSPDIQILEIPLPASFEATGIISRYIEVKHNLFGLVYDQDAWTVAIDAWVVNSSGINNAVQTISAGTY